MSKNELENVKPEGSGDVVPEEPKDVKTKKPGALKKIGTKVKKAFKAAKDSPVATVVGAVFGSVLTLGGLALGTYVRHRNDGEEEYPEGEAIEQEFEEDADETCEDADNIE